jgi:hypothetical protein
MKNKRYFQVMWVFTILVVISLSCSLGLSALEEEIEESINTEVEELVTNADAISTEVGSLVTDIDLEGMVTDIDIEGMVTDIDFEAMVTEIDLDNLFGVQGEKPADIPVMEGYTDEFFSATLVEYVVNVALNQVVAYYDREMPVNGWTKVDAESKVQADSAELVYEKGGRKAKITIEKDFFSDGMFVSIEITGT